ncbi:hypothetical protein H2200_012711 [Cladophialophora chaetospira]|uniref:Uncharacterized protein n=1 Tax=Cladophialophora chaetospira TaxID=386627 RepID=A0AA39CC89_9EURO|nr:hypothetical protein H2200_012711 [Cladophialophora chaetospira]
MIRAILKCVGARKETGAVSIAKTQSHKAELGHDSGDVQRANEIVEAMQDAEKTGEELRMKVTDVVKVNNWTESLAKAVLARLDDTIKKGVALKGPLKEAYDKAVAAAVGFARDHPVWTTLIALGMLAILLPWVLEALGFGEAGPVAGRFAAWWMRRYAGYVSKGSLYSFLQRLGMVWRRHVGVKAML